MFTRSGSTWSQQAYLRASNEGDGDAFGSSVALWGDMLAVGADVEDGSALGVGGTSNDNALNAGAVYVFTRAGSVWSQEAYVKASNTEAYDVFGASVALSADALAISAYGDRQRPPASIIATNDLRPDRHAPPLFLQRQRARSPRFAVSAAGVAAFS